MCKCLQYCLESCYWHLIEKRFCYDESIALYEVPEKEEKNNNFFDNMAFYDSVSVIAGRAVVTIDPLPEEKPIVQQPTRRLRWENEQLGQNRWEKLSKSVPAIFDAAKKEEEREKIEAEKRAEDEGNSGQNPEPEPRDSVDKPKLETLKPENLVPEIRRRSLAERRLSKSLYLKIDQPKEIPIIRQQSMPKFYVDTPEERDQQHTSMFRTPSSALASPVPKSSAFVYDLYSVVQMERERVKHMDTQVPVHRKESDRSSRLLQIRDKIKLRRVKSSLGTPVTNLPHSHQHI
ncbi:uncharacterized protein LOC103313705 isoform X2 [Tribolium castaneum]|uniref:Uncharacterized protein n=1 Tax=Tribolium castaneum TaxID=7070 RepID=A0A139WEL1_TRICA|nr:PREDICTED: uncharacterized protein LOC103313705 isoform X2 [Tribolium castaneum]XP_008195912.1 PREDICTED: uncharacterized protein LOC103313705 isoform X2 [Tribolium castaneum]KYB26400.1 hypothetical protein TcasGA2_TC033784 [Tribolium castaneum]|eukprot:XP_008195911.1 PREDICTED: uncharacterized protein LOC103313705 isoform X2 [Tribolium castaneum]